MNIDIDINIHIFLQRNWVDTRGQKYSTHLQTTI